MAFLVSDHIGEKLLDEIEMGDKVDIDEFPEPLWGRVQDAVGIGDSSIIAQNRGRSQRLSHSFCYLLHLVWRCDVALEERDTVQLLQLLG